MGHLGLASGHRHLGCGQHLVSGHRGIHTVAFGTQHKGIEIVSALQDRTVDTGHIGQDTGRFHLVGEDHRVFVGDQK
ncbi:MAG: hypothetical protein IKZ06_00970, partial [Oscillospiraceae bacterium]|nr:hypothetical protein [Oscillospiraceae bacterium]